jgi:hypothetical protein
MNPIDFEVKWSKIKGQTGHINILTTQYLGNPFCTLYADNILNSRQTILILRSKAKGQTGLMNKMTTQYLEIPLLDKTSNFVPWYIMNTR